MKYVDERLVGAVAITMDPIQLRTRALKSSASNPRNERVSENPFSLSDDDLMMEAGLYPQRNRKWKRLIEINGERFANRTAGQLKDRFQHLRDIRA